MAASSNKYNIFHLMATKSRDGSEVYAALRRAPVTNQLSYPISSRVAERSRIAKADRWDANYKQTSPHAASTLFIRLWETEC
eukprot:scaffold4787_cov38-Prasinocladus_malaysianus.AAC.1